MSKIDLSITIKNETPILFIVPNLSLEIVKKFLRKNFENIIKYQGNVLITYGNNLTYKKDGFLAYRTVSTNTVFLDDTLNQIYNIKARNFLKICFKPNTKFNIEELKTNINGI